MSEQKATHGDGQAASFATTGGTTGAQGVFNGEVTIYIADPNDPPERRLQVAKNYLSALMPGPAQGLLMSVIGQRYLRGRVSLHHMFRNREGATG
ncbi:hypothetical protein AB0C69_37465, partial [Actinomadura sp. NPDC048032]|uniref:hypothetical protein n=1 Tax=Actinomadura sp. NPDC048032 TaxID=3155747 RepID=UPI0033CE447F